VNILALETSAKAVSCAVVRDGALIASAFQATGLTHSRTLMPMVETMLQNSELSLTDMDAVAVAIGPGSFTGLRIGVSAAKGLAWALGKPCVAVSTLEAMSRNAACWQGLVVCAMDARRNQVYNALFEANPGGFTRLSEDRAISLAELADELTGESRPILVVGDGAHLALNHLQNVGIPCRPAPPGLVLQSAVGVGLVAHEMLLRGETVSAQELRPNYLRLSQAERERLARGQSITID